MVGGEGIAFLYQTCIFYLTDQFKYSARESCVTEYSDRETCKRTDLL